MATIAIAGARWPRAARVVAASLEFPNLMVLVAAVPAVVILALLVLIGGVSVRETVVDASFTLRHYVNLYTDAFAYRAILNTIGFTLSTMAVALAIGVTAAWLVERTDLPGKGVVFAAMTLGLLIPGFFLAMGWLFLLHPRIGMVNRLLMDLLSLETAPLSIVNVVGMGWVQGLGLASLVFIMVAASLRALDPALEESAQTSGASFVQMLRRVTVPLAFPSLLAAALYILTIGISAFDVPLIIGVSNRLFTFSTYLYVQTHPQEGLPEYGQPAAFSSFMVILALGLSWWYGRVLVQARRYEVITGKAYRPRLVPLGRWVVVAWLFLGGYILLAKILPLLLLAWAAVLPYLRPPSFEALQAVSLRNFTALPWSLVMRGLSHTAVLAVGAPTLALLLSVVFSWVILRSRHRFRLVFDFVAFLPHAVPNVIFGLGALIAALFLVRWPVDLYGTVALLLLVYALVQISFGTRLTNSALIQIHSELEEAGYVSGASTLTVLRRVVAPLLRPALLYGWLWLALHSVRELTLATMLFSPDNVTLPVVIWDLWHNGNLSQAAAVSLVMLGMLIPLVVLYWRFSETFRARTL